MVTAQIWLLLAALPFCLSTIYSDLSRLKIPNKTVAGLALAFVIVAPFVLPFDVYLMRLAQGVIALAVGFVLFLVAGFGAGDAKFLGAAAPYFGGLDAAPFMFAATLIILASLVTQRLVALSPLRRLALNWKSWTADKFPFGVPLAAITIFALVVQTVPDRFPQLSL